MRSGLAEAHQSAISSLEGAVLRLQGLSRSLAEASVGGGNADLAEEAEEGRARAVAQVHASLVVAGALASGAEAKLRCVADRSRDALRL